MNKEFTERDIDLADRIARMEIKIDVLLDHAKEFKGFNTLHEEKTDKLDLRVSELEVEKKLVKRIIAPITHLMTGVLGGWIMKYFQ